jgi:hypothetical protein
MPTSLTGVGNFVPAGGTSSGGGGNVIPSQSRTISEIQAINNWKQPGNAGDTGGPNPSLPSGTMIWTPGAIATQLIQPNYPYNNAYWYLPLGAFNWANYFIYDMQVQYANNTAISVSQALEFELQQNVNDQIFNMAWQADFGGGFWRTFDKANRRWVATNIRVSRSLFSNSAWVSISAEYSRTASTTTHVSLTINGVRYGVGVTRPSVPAVQSDYLNAAYQLDSNKDAVSYSTHTTHMSVTAEAF